MWFESDGPALLLEPLDCREPGSTRWRVTVHCWHGESELEYSSNATPAPRFESEVEALHFHVLAHPAPRNCGLRELYAHLIEDRRN